MRLKLYFVVVVAGFVVVVVAGFVVVDGGVK